MNTLRLLLAAGPSPAADHVPAEPATNQPALRPADSDFMKKSLPFHVGLLAAMTIIGFSNIGKSQAATVTSLFDGKTLDGWIDQENSANQFGGGDIKDLNAFAKKLLAKSDSVSAFLNGKLGETNVA